MPSTVPTETTPHTAYVRINLNQKNPIGPAPNSPGDFGGFQMFSTPRTCVRSTMRNGSVDIGVFLGGTPRVGEGRGRALIDTDRVLCASRPVSACERL